MRRLEAVIAGMAMAMAHGPAAHAEARTYQNPLPLRLADGALAQNCADPAILREPRARPAQWYLYCTTDPVSRTEKEGAGWRFRLMPIYRSSDLVHWNFVADAFTTRPAPAMPTAGLWAPEPVFHNGRYYLYYTITDVDDPHSPEAHCASDSAIGVATSASPAGPWEPAPGLVVPPRRAGPGCDFHWTFDPDVVEAADGRRYLYYGSYGGGIYVQPLTADGLGVTGTPVRVGASGRYEGAEVVRHGADYYLFASSTDCCAGPLTGYSVFVGRARSPQGPFLDRFGNDMASPRPGGTPVLTQNGNRWVGPGHNTVFADDTGQWWTIYHAIDRADPFFSVADKLTRRLANLDRLEWVDGWPVIARGAGPTDTPQAAPGAAPTSAPSPVPTRVTKLWRERFALGQPGPRWHWIGPQATPVGAGPGLRLTTEAGDLYQDRNDAGILATPIPEGSVRIEAKVGLDAPEDCCAAPVQAGLVLLRDPDNYVKLVELAHAGLRQVEFAKEVGAPPPGYPRYGNTVVGTPGRHTWLRLDAVRDGREERYTAWSSQDGLRWVRGGTWTHQLGAGVQLGLVAMGGAGRQATFAEVRVSRLR